MSRALLLAMAGLFGGALTFLVREPSIPTVSDAVGYQRWEALTGLMLGAVIGVLLGGVSGYLQGSRGHIRTGILSGGAIGAAAGLLGIMIGSTVFNALGMVPGGILIARMVGWAIMGGLIGLGEGAVGLSWKRAYYGLVGGVLGGALAGFLFEASASVVGQAQASLAGQGRIEVGTVPRAVGFSVLGAAIGLLIGVVEALAKRASVRLVLGRNEGKEWAIDAPQFNLGRAENAHVPLMGDPLVQPYHACIRRENGRYVIYDLQTPIGIAVNGVPTRQAVLQAGDSFQIGHFTLQFLVRGARRGAPVAAPGRMPEPMASQMAHTMPQPMPTGMPTGMPAGSAAGTPTQAVMPTSTPTVMSPAATTSGVRTLVAMQGPLTGQRFQIAAAVDIGRECPAIPLQADTQASRRHARLEPTPQGLHVQDLGSTNGVYVDGVRVPQAILIPGQTLTLGSSTFRLE